MLFDILQIIAENGRATPVYVAELKDLLSGRNEIDQKTVETILAVDLSLQATCVEWEELLKTTVLRFVICPEQLLSVYKANWLQNAISRHGLVDDHERFELLLRVIEAARNVPESLVLLALKQVEEAVLNEVGPIAHLKSGEHKAIDSVDVDLIRRILVGAQKMGAVPLSSKEIAILFELNEQTMPYHNSAVWRPFFRNAVANFVLGKQPDQAQSRAKALSCNEDRNFDEKIELCVLELRIVGEMGRGFSNVEREERLEFEKCPADWVLDRCNRNEMFSDDQNLLNYATKIASGGRLHSGTIAA